MDKKVVLLILAMFVGLIVGKGIMADLPVVSGSKVPPTPDFSTFKVEELTAGNSKLMLINCSPPYQPFTLHLNRGWNLISIPGWDPTGNQFTSMFPPTVFGAYYYDPWSRSYRITSRLIPCYGYWVFSTDDQDVDMCINPQCVCCYNLTTGWSMVGAPWGLSSPGPGFYFGYDSNIHSYYIPSNLEGGNGYFFYNPGGSPYFCINSTSSPCFNESLNTTICENRTITIPPEFSDEPFTPIHNYTEDECCWCVEGYNYLISHGYLVSPDWWFDDCWAIGPASLAYQVTGNSTFVSQLLAYLNTTCIPSEYLGNESENESCLNISVDKGWNLISSPYQDTKLHPSGVIYHYSNGKYLPVKMMVPGMGYWYYSKVRQNLTLCGKPTDIKLTFSKGKSYIGVPTEMSISDLRSQVKDGKLSVYGYTDGKYSPVDVLHPGYGYLIDYDGPETTLILSHARPRPEWPPVCVHAVSYRLNPGTNFIYIPITHATEIWLDRTHVGSSFPLSTGSLPSYLGVYQPTITSFYWWSTTPASQIYGSEFYVIDNSDSSSHLLYICGDNWVCSSPYSMFMNLTLNCSDEGVWIPISIPYLDHPSDRITVRELADCLGSDHPTLYELDPSTPVSDVSASLSITGDDLIPVSSDDHVNSGMVYFVHYPDCDPHDLYSLISRVYDCLNFCDYECVDEDHGINSYITAHTYLQSETGGISSMYTDRCLDDGSLLEYYCDDNTIQSTTVPCVEGCSEGSCEHTCEDHDSGHDYFTPSYVTTESGDMDDYCNSDHTGLFESYCNDDGMPMSVFVYCTCAEDSYGRGYCTDEPEEPAVGCTDYDDPYNHNSPTELLDGSSAVDITGYYYDTCLDEYTIQEANCGPDGFYYSTVPCPTDTVCIESPTGDYCGTHCGDDVCEPEFGEDIDTCPEDCGCVPEPGFEGIETTKYFPLNVEVAIYWHDMTILHSFEHNPNYFLITQEEIYPGDPTPPGIPPGRYTHYTVEMEDVLPGECDLNDFVMDIYLEPYGGDTSLGRDVYFVKRSSSSAAEFDFTVNFHETVTGLYDYDDPHCTGSDSTPCRTRSHGDPYLYATLWRSANLGVSPGSVRHLKIWQE